MRRIKCIFSAKEEASLSTLTLDVLKSSEIEGEKLDYDQVRSSIARRLGINIAGLVPTNRNVDGVVEMMLDATQNYQKPLINKRLYAWHFALFPTGHSGMHKIEVGRYRSGEMEKFLNWFNDNSRIDPVLKSAIAYFWFIIIHPFDDGNGRIARAISDLMLARADKTTERYYSMSSQILLERKKYYEILFLENT